RHRGEIRLAHRVMVRHNASGCVRVGSQKAKFLKNCANVRDARMPGRQAQQIDDATRLILPEAALTGSSRSFVHYRLGWRRATARKASRTKTSRNSVATSGGAPARTWRT